MLNVLSRTGLAGQVFTPVEIPIPIPTVTGRHLAHARLTPSQRAAIAAAIQLDEMRYERPTAIRGLERSDALVEKEERWVGRAG